jgi:hypothetical protein
MKYPPGRLKKLVEPVVMFPPLNIYKYNELLKKSN